MSSILWVITPFSPLKDKIISEKQADSPLLVIIIIIIIIIIRSITFDRLCGLVLRVPGYRSRGPGSIPGVIIFSEK
jgi:hypothetical protein